MRAIQLTEHGAPSVLRMRDVPDPEPGPGEVAVQVRACAVNALDIAVRYGATETEIPLPLILGADVAGTVMSVGDGAAGVRVGERVAINPRFYCGACPPCLRGEQSACLNYEVLGWHRNGGYAEQLVVPHANVVTIGDAVSFEEAAAAPITFTTAWRMLVTRAQVRPGERVLIYGASGGVGSAAIEIARMLGARVAAVTSSPAKLEQLKALGPELVLVLGAADFDSALRDWTDGRGVDVVVQTLGGDTWQQSLENVSRLGRVVVCSAARGADPPAQLGTLLWKQLTVYGSTGGTPVDFTGVMQLVSARKLKPVVSQTFLLHDAARAHALFEKREHVGKIVLTTEI